MREVGGLRNDNQVLLPGWLLLSEELILLCSKAQFVFLQIVDSTLATANLSAMPLQFKTDRQTDRQNHLLLWRFSTLICFLAQIRPSPRLEEVKGDGESSLLPALGIHFPSQDVKYFYFFTLFASYASLDTVSKEIFPSVFQKQSIDYVMLYI